MADVESILLDELFALKERLRVLGIEPYFGGSHQYFMEGWSERSKHDWTLLTLPPHNWKWRMRHSALEMAKRISEMPREDLPWDMVVCSDMLNLAEFKGLVSAPIHRLPTVVYFHENQWTYPNQHHDPRDFHFGFTNFTSAVAADEVWFNSQFHQDEMLLALRNVIGKMPDFPPTAQVDQLQRKSSVHYPGIEEITPGDRLATHSDCHITWAARWEHDKAPATFFEAINRLDDLQIPFELSVMGQAFRSVPEVFDLARTRFQERIRQWGFLASRQAYLDTLRETDLFVSTAHHEFFGLTVLEAIAAGAFPLLPRRLSYPELLDVDNDSRMTDFFYDGSAGHLAERLATLIRRRRAGELWNAENRVIREKVTRLQWSTTAPLLDQGLIDLAARHTA